MENWHYLDNQFENKTRNSYRKMNILAADHLAKLDAEQSDPVIATLFNRFNPVYQDFENAYAKWKASVGQYKGATQLIDELQQQLSSDHIADWDNQIKVAVGEGTPNYVSILPNGRKPFQSGGRDQRIVELKALSDRLANYPALAALKQDVDAFHTQIKQVRHFQQTKEDEVELYSDALENQRVAVANVLYANLGALMDKHYEDPSVIDRFYELQLIRTSSHALDEMDELQEIAPIAPDSLDTDDTSPPGPAAA